MEMSANAIVDHIRIDEEWSGVFHPDPAQLADCSGMDIDDVVVETDVDGLEIGTMPEERVDRVRREGLRGHDRTFHRDHSVLTTNPFTVIWVNGVLPQPPLIDDIAVP